MVPATAQRTEEEGLLAPQKNSWQWEVRLCCLDSMSLGATVPAPPGQRVG